MNMTNYDELFINVLVEEYVDLMMFYVVSCN